MAGNTITFNALTSGGTGPFTYTFYIYNSITKTAINTVQPGSTNSFAFVTNSNLVGNTLNANVFVTDGDGRSANSILVGPYNIISLSCTFSLSNTVVNFGTLTPGTQLGTNSVGWNSVLINNIGTVASNVYISGSNWNYGIYSFAVTNTVWNWNSYTPYASSNQLFGTQSDTKVQIGSSGSKNIYFGIGVPLAQAGSGSSRFPNR